MKKILKVLAIVLNFLLGCILGWLVFFGFLNLNGELIIIIGAGLFAMLHAGVWYQVLFRAENYKRLTKIVITIQLLIGLLIGGLYFSQRIMYQNQPMTKTTYVGSFTKLWKAMDQAYPYFSLKGVDWDTIYDKYFPRIESVQSDQEFYLTIAEMLGELNDAHTNVVTPYLGERMFASVINRGELAIIQQVGYSGMMAGLEPGMLLLRVDRKDLDDIVPTIDMSLDNSSTPWMRQIRAYEKLLIIPDNPDELLDITVIDQNGVEKNISIKLLETPQDWEPQSIWPQPPAVEWKRLTNDIGYIRIDRLWNNGDDIVKEFDSAMNELIQTKGIILDLRLNGGGDSVIGDKIAGRFLSEPFEYGQDHFRKRIYKFAWRKTVNGVAKPRMDVYAGKVVVLTDYAVMSSAEWLVGALVDSGRAISIGRVTGGATGNPIQFSLPGGSVRYSTASFTRPNGNLVEGVGYQPNIEIEWTVKDYLNNNDPDIEAAIKWIENQ